MSPRTENYLALCLEQAELSPLHYRHGCIIVKGGKIIGQGFNTYRPGFDGGSLKTRVLPNEKLDGPAICELKLRLKTKRKSKFNISTPDDQQQQSEQSTFTPFEFLSGGGHNANTPLSMHSEMMAIQNALSLSSGAQSYQTSARSAQWLQKPCFKLSGHSKRKARLRGLKAYVETVCAEAESAAQKGTGGNRAGKFCLQESCFEPDSSQPGCVERERQRQQGGGRGGEPKEQWRETPNEEERVRVLQESTADSIPSNDNDSPEHSSDIHHTSNLHHTNWKKLRTPKPLKPPRSQPLLVPKGVTGQSSPKANISARTKDLRLKGADLYVARLGNIDSYHANPTHSIPTIPNINTSSAPLPPESPIPTTSTGSLYDELKCISHKPPPPPILIEPPHITQRPTRISRPCYRCITHMDAVGIKRVFWSNGSGGWEGAKVRELMDALEVGGEGEGGGCGEEGEKKGMPVFVTKHEVLMLRRKMGGS